jgi:decaprenylphospho-beta-D-erythro-pentofuranosid-2-ulose 2-reductase
VKVALLGATKGMGRALARILVERGHSVCLLGHEPDDLQRSVADLQARARGPVTIGQAPCDLEKPETFAQALDAADGELGGLEAVVVTAALFATQEKLEADRAFALRLLTADFANTVIFCEEARVRLLARGGGSLVVFSSVAGDRGRKPVILYGAAKAGISAYLEGLDHKFHAAGLRVLTVKPGFVKTGMTAGLRPPPFAGEPEGVARQVANALERGKKPVIYAPPMWGLVMAIIRRLPRFVMRKIGF